MGDDRVKKGARRIVNFACQNGCDLIIMEKLAGLIPDAEKERGINRALVSWNRGHLVKWIKQLAGDAGIRVIEVYPPLNQPTLLVLRGLWGAIFGRSRATPFRRRRQIIRLPRVRVYGQRRPQRLRNQGDNARIVCRLASAVKGGWPVDGGSRLR